MKELNQVFFVFQVIKRHLQNSSKPLAATVSLLSDISSQTFCNVILLSYCIIRVTLFKYLSYITHVQKRYGITPNVTHFLNEVFKLTLHHNSELHQ